MGRRWLYVAIVGSIAIFLALSLGNSEDSAKLELHNGKIIYLEVAQTLPDRMRGLSGRESLPSDSGMLFIFPDQHYHGIWMKDMNFALDIIWLNDIMEVVHLERDVSPATYPRVFTPPTPALYVLELPNGTVDHAQIKLKQKLNINL